MAKPIIEITVDKKKAVKLSASGEFNAQHAQEIKTKYLEVLQGTSSVHLDLEKVVAFDVAALQLTYLLKKEVEKKGRKVSIALPQTPVLKALLEKSSIHKIL